MDYRCSLVAIIYFIIIHKAEQYENLSLNKTATVSQRYNNKDFDPSLAVDGDHSTDMLKCSLTASGQKEAWLTVDLGEEKNIAFISFIHGGLGVNAKPIDYNTSGIYRRGTSNTVQTGLNDSRWLCRDHFTAYDAQVVCLIWGFLPDSGNIGSRGATSFGSFSSKNYECVGNETSIHDCPDNEKKCTSTTMFLPRTELRCKQGDTLSGFSVHVSDTTDWRSGTLCYQHDIEQPMNNTVNIDCVTSGRYVTIYNSRNNTDASLVSEFAYINICELNITGCNIGFYGENCRKCPDNCLNDTCQFKIGHCFGCKEGFQGEMCEEENLALSGTVTVSQRYNNKDFDPSLAVDGDHSTDLLKCSLTASGQKEAWLTVDLGEERNIASISFIHGGCCNIGFYGENCRKCPDNCLNGTCQFQTGHCFGCKDGFQGEMCEEECPQGRYGKTCSLQCKNCLNQLPCDHITGFCKIGCSSGWMGDRCNQKCHSTLYGTNCNTTCSEYCQNRICNHINGYCLECIEAHVGNFCENKLAAQVVVLTLFTLKRRCLSSRKATTLDYDVSDVKTIDRKYETLQRKTVADKAGIDTTAEYMEISAITSDIN
uniref:SRCR domain-containing protein n=1 Tax=Magallana gigas TaxID=29159 RepID=A0A8W8P4D4_MAGGI